jgi:glutaredoxin-like protein NrdH
MKMIEMEHVPGTSKGKVTLFALSTCGWCAKTKALLKELGVDHYYVFVDLLPQEDLEDVIKEVEKFNPHGSFPTLVINDGTHVIIGFREQEIREALG